MKLITRIRAWRYERRRPRGDWELSQGGYVPGTGEPIQFWYQHDLPMGEKDHIIRVSGDDAGKCSVCGEQVVDMAKLHATLDKFNRKGTK